VTKVQFLSGPAVGSDLPPINGVPEALAAPTAIVAGVSGGDLTAAEGSELSKLVDHYLRALEAKDCEQRLHKLASEPPKDPDKPDDAFQDDPPRGPCRFCNMPEKISCVGSAMY
jgi:hypothetical protein